MIWTLIHDTILRLIICRRPLFVTRVLEYSDINDLAFTYYKHMLTIVRKFTTL